MTINYDAIQQAIARQRQRDMQQRPLYRILRAFIGKYGVDGVIAALATIARQYSATPGSTDKSAEHWEAVARSLECTEKSLEAIKERL